MHLKSLIVASLATVLATVCLFLEESTPAQAQNYAQGSLQLSDKTNEQISDNDSMNITANTISKTASNWDAITAKLPVRVWQHETPDLRGIIVAVHGMTQHAGTFETFAKKLTAQGFTFVGLDMRGHGKWYHEAPWNSAGKICDYNQSANDLNLLITDIKRTFTKVPIYCLGESVGSAVVVHAAVDQPNLVNGIILVSAGTSPRFFDPMMVAGDFINGIRALHTQMDVTRYIMHYSSNDKRICEGMVNDPLSRQTLTPLEILKVRFFLAGTPNIARQLPPNLSVMVLTGGMDHIVSPDSTRKLFANIKSSDKKFVWMPQCGHVLLGTKFLDSEVVDSITSWLNEKATLASKDLQRQTALATDSPNIQ